MTKAETRRQLFDVLVHIENAHAQLTHEDECDPEHCDGGDDHDFDHDETTFEVGEAFEKLEILLNRLGAELLAEAGVS